MIGSSFVEAGHLTYLALGEQRSWSSIKLLVRAALGAIHILTPDIVNSAYHYRFLKSESALPER